MFEHQLVVVGFGEHCEHQRVPQRAANKYFRTYYTYTHTHTHTLTQTDY